VRAIRSAVYDPFGELLPEGFAGQFETLGEEWAIAEHSSNPTYPAATPIHRSTHSAKRLAGERSI
jgi:hypothetical protein